MRKSKAWPVLNFFLSNHIKMNYSDWIGVSGWALSLVLGYLKIKEFYINRFKVYVFFSSNSYEKRNIITIASKKTITIVYYQLFFAVNKSENKQKEYVETGIEEDWCNIKIPPDSSYSFVFEEMLYFNLENAKFQGKKLYISLNIVGRQKSLIKLVYDPKNLNYE
jgi:hypothetical protein